MYTHSVVNDLRKSATSLQSTTVHRNHFYLPTSTPACAYAMLVITGFHVQVGEYCVLNGNGTTSPLNPQLPSKNAFLSQSYAVPAELVRESDPTSAPPPGSPQHNTSHIPIGNDPMYAVPSKPRFQKHRQNTPSSTVGTSSKKENLSSSLAAGLGRNPYEVINHEVTPVHLTYSHRHSRIQ